MNLAHLPVATRTIFFANLLAVLFLVGLVVLDVNAASCVLFPMVVSASQGSLMFFLKFGAVHAIPGFYELGECESRIDAGRNDVGINLIAIREDYSSRQAGR